jgi:hypothetical protein
VERETPRAQTGVSVPRRERRGFRELCGDGFVAFQGLADVVGGDSAFAANAPVVATKFDDGGGQRAVGFAGVEDERKTIAELAEDFFAGFAGGGAGKVGAGAGERDTEFRDEVTDDFVFGPAESDAASVGGDLQGKAVGSLNDDGERAGPAGLGEAKKIVGKVFGKDLGVNERVDEDRKGAVFGASLDAKNFFDSGEIDGISGEGVKRVRGNGNNRTAI